MRDETGISFFMWAEIGCGVVDDGEERGRQQQQQQQQQQQ